MPLIDAFQEIKTMFTEAISLGKMVRRICVLLYLKFIISYFGQHIVVNSTQENDSKCRRNRENVRSRNCGLKNLIVSEPSKIKSIVITTTTTTLRREKRILENKNCKIS